MTSSAPSQAASERETSDEKSTWPGVSMKFSAYSWPSRARYDSVTGCILIVMPRSRSRSIASSTCSSICRRPIVLVTSSKRSESVVFPWSMWAMMQKLRTNDATRSLDARPDSEIISIVVGAGESRNPTDEITDQEDDDQERYVEPADGRDDAAHRNEHRLDDPRDVIGPAALQTWDP